MWEATSNKLRAVFNASERGGMLNVSWELNPTIHSSEKTIMWIFSHDSAKHTKPMLSHSNQSNQWENEVMCWEHKEEEEKKNIQIAPHNKVPQYNTHEKMFASGQS